jgi:Ca2+-binding EF-hand superfamily protein
MKINEVTQPSDKALFESLDKNNDTGFATGDLVKIHRAHTGNWEAASYDDLMAELDNLQEIDNAATK